MIYSESVILTISSRNALMVERLNGTRICTTSKPSATRLNYELTWPNIIDHSNDFHQAIIRIDIFDQYAHICISI